MLKQNLVSYFSTRTYIVGTQKNSQCDGFAHTQQMFKLMDKKIFTIFRLKYLPILRPGTYCAVAFPHGSMGWSAVCDCSIS